MKPTKAYILRIDTPLSRGYAEGAAQSCRDVGLPFEFFEGYHAMNPRASWDATGIKYPNDLTRYDHMIDNPTCCSAGHAAIWKLIGDRDECAVVLEHDALMLHPIDIDVPDNRIVVLGYKLRDHTRYDHVTAGPPTRVFDIDGHEGAHAYAMTGHTARTLVQEIETRGILGCVDNAYFIRGQRGSKTPLAMMEPTPAIAWLRKSTLWAESAEVNYHFIDSFRNNLR